MRENKCLICNRFVVGRNRYRPKLRFTGFYASWTISSFVLLVTVFEFEVVPFLELLLYENVIVVLMASFSVLMTAVIRSRSRDQSFASSSSCCQSSDKRVMSTRSFRDKYYAGLQSVISSRNRGCFIAGLLCTICCLTYSSHLIMSTICHPVLVAEWILVPDDCSDVFSDAV